MKKLFILFSMIILCDNTHGQEISRKDLVQKALAKSHQVYISEKKAELSLLDKQKAMLTYVPDVNFNASYMRLNDDISFSVPPIQIPLGPQQVLEKQLDPIILKEKDIFNVNIDAQMVLFSGLQAPLLSSAAHHKYNAEKAMVDKQSSEVILAVIKSYDRLALLDQSLKVLEESKKRLAKQTQYVKKAFQNGLASSYDLKKIEVATEEIRTKEIELNGKRKLVLLHLEQLTGVSRDQLKNQNVSLEPWERLSVESTIQKRAELRALNEGILASEKKKKAETAKYLPKIVAFGKRELYEDDLSALDPLWYAGIGLKWDLFDGFQRTREIQKAKIQKDIRMREKEDVAEKLKLNLEKCKDDLETAEQLIEVSQKRVDLSREGLEITIKEYKVGLTGITERLAADMDYQNAQLDLLQAIYNQRMASIQLMNATGELTVDNL